MSTASLPMFYARRSFRPCFSLHSNYCWPRALPFSIATIAVGRFNFVVNTLHAFPSTKERALNEATTNIVCVCMCK